jgi:FMN phosphatase YigB (HAD superfamily)
MSQKRWLFLDIGNVIVDVDQDRSRDLFASLTGLPREEFDWIFFDSRLIDVFNRGEVDDVGFVLRVQAEVRYRGAAITPQQVKDVWNAMIVLRPEVDEWLKELEPEFEGLWIISDINPYHWEVVREHLREVGLKRLRGATLSYELGAMKPAASLYADALARSGAAPQAAFFLDDRSGNVEAARRAGMTSIVYLGVDSADQQVWRWLTLGR